MRHSGCRVPNEFSKYFLCLVFASFTLHTEYGMNGPGKEAYRRFDLKIGNARIRIVHT